MFSTLQFNHLRLSRGSRCLCKDLTLDIAPGEVLEITGANGTGKTSLLRLVAGLGDAGMGRIVWRNREAGEITAADGDLIYLAYQPDLTPELSVSENLEFYRKLRPVQGQSIEAALEYFEIGHLRNLSCARLSEGQRCRVALSRLLTEPASWWLLDEPEAALDQAAIVLFEKLLAKHLAENNSALIATHRHLKPASGRIKHLELPC